MVRCLYYHILIVVIYLAFYAARAEGLSPHRGGGGTIICKKITPPLHYVTLVPPTPLVPPPHFVLVPLPGGQCRTMLTAKAERFVQPNTSYRGL